MLSLNNNYNIMKTIQPLKTLINIFFYLLCFSAFIYFSSLILYFMPPFEFLPDGLLKTHTDIDNDTVLYVFTVVFTFAFIFFVKGIYHLRKTIPILIRGDYFSEDISKQFQLSGLLFIIVGIVSLIVHIESQVYLNSMVWFGIDNQIYTFIFLIIIGLFFKLFSLVLKEARIAKEENDLTI